VPVPPATPSQERDDGGEAAVAAQRAQGGLLSGHGHLQRLQRRGEAAGAIVMLGGHEQCVRHQACHLIGVRGARGLGGGQGVLTRGQRQLAVQVTQRQQRRGQRPRMVAVKET
jgi:hypothetical protein